MKSVMFVFSFMGLVFFYFYVSCFLLERFGSALERFGSSWYTFAMQIKVNEVYFFPLTLLKSEDKLHLSIKIERVPFILHTVCIIFATEIQE